MASSNEQLAAQLVPDVLGDIHEDVAPATMIVGHRQFDGVCGEVLAASETDSKPALAWAADPEAWYTLIMTDPDAPSREDPTYREFVHWYVFVVRVTGAGGGAGACIRSVVHSRVLCSGLARR